MALTNYDVFKFKYSGNVWSYVLIYFNIIND